MHKTAFKIGGLAIQRYNSGPGTRILELGAYDVNGSLKHHVPDDMHYVGVDLEAGPGVDIVVELAKPLPFEDQAFDLALASSVFEHDPVFWATFLELVRVVRRGGYIYLNVPSNGGFHRFPEDSWRFYPDSGHALARWATSQDLPVELIESFICEQDDVNWNDFTAVFRRLPADGPRPNRFIYTEVPSYNIHCWQAKDLIRPQGETQDMLLIAASQAESAQLKAALDTTQAEAEQLRGAREAAEALANQLRFARDASAAEAAELKSAREAAEAALHQVESELCQRQEEIAQYLGQLEAAGQAAVKSADEISSLRAKLAESEGWVASLAKYRAEAEKRFVQLELALAKAAEQVAERDRTIVALAAEATEIGHERDQLRERELGLNALVHEREQLWQSSERNVERLQHELVTAQQQIEAGKNFVALAEAEAGHQRSLAAARAAGEEWLRHVHIVLQSQPLWWCLLPSRHRRARELDLLLANGLFDGQRYLAEYSDVAAEGMDPLRHFIWHGMQEGRSRRFD